MQEQINISDIIITWILFWVLLLAGLAIFAGCILAPLWQEHVALAMEYQHVHQKIHGMQQEVDQVNEQLSALWVDPAYTERIARSELNLRKAGEETLYIEPLPIYFEESIDPDFPESLSAIASPRDFSDTRWYPIFLDARKRDWLMYLSLGLIASGLIIAIVSKDRRYQALGF